MSSIWTLVFWQAAGERAIKTFAGSLLGYLGIDSVKTGITDVDWGNALSIAALATLLSILFSIVSSGINGQGPSLGPEQLKEK